MIATFSWQRRKIQAEVPSLDAGKKWLRGAATAHKSYSKSRARMTVSDNSETLHSEVLKP